jgi:hypothetical protein|tara:strand:+ start:66 stop:458 length:393 start_codon:yes stop_codon:yes gene_type:complete
MAQFIEFNCINNAAVQPLGPNNRVLVNVDTIRTITATGATGANPKTVVLGFDTLVAGSTATNPKDLTLTVSTDKAAAVNPTITSGNTNPLVDAVRSALTANPGGVKTKCVLGNDQAATPVQMYWRTATYS